MRGTSVAFIPRRIPAAVVRRLSSYLRALSELLERGVELVPSEELGRLAGSSGAQVRRDLAYFGTFGIKGVGYKVSELKGKLEEILGVDRRWNVALVGVGNLGSALIAYEGFKRRGFDVVVGFDVDRSKVGRRHHGVEIKHISEMGKVLREKGVRIAIIAVPASSAQAVADALVEAGIEAILNFAPTRISAPGEVVLKNVDLSMELEELSFYLTHKEIKDGEPVSELS